jgi:HK97 family phage major capsid protein
LVLAVDEDEASAYWGTSVQTPTQTNTPTIGQQEIPVRDLNAEPRASQNFLDDAASDPEAWLMRKVSEKFARAEATAFVSGNGVDAPRGFLTYPSGAGTRGTIEQVNSGDASALTDELIINLETALKAGYRSGAIYWMARATEGKVRLMKDGMGNYMWQPSYQLGAPRTLNGYPYALFEDMPAVTANALAVGFGNLRTGYTIVDRQGVRVLRDPYTAKPFVKFFTTKRVGGDVTNFEAIKLGKVAI